MYNSCLEKSDDQVDKIIDQLHLSKSIPNVIFKFVLKVYK